MSVFYTCAQKREGSKGFSRLVDYARRSMAPACGGNPGSPLTQKKSLRVCAAPRRRTALTWMHDEHTVRVPMSPREPAPPENQLDSPVLVAWSVTCGSPPPAVLEPSSPVAPASEPLVNSPWILGTRHARHALAPRRALTLCEIDTAVCQGSPSSPLSSPRSSASKANGPESPWRAAWPHRIPDTENKTR